VVIYFNGEEIVEMVDPEQLPFVEMPGPRRDHDLVFYSLSTCAMCRKAAEYLAEMGFAYRVLLVDRLDPEVKNRLRDRLSRVHSMRVTFPALVVDATRVVLGFFRKSWEDVLRQGESHV
jgi:glutaredoxin